jgi:hypothetical protein
VTKKKAPQSTCVATGPFLDLSEHKQGFSVLARGPQAFVTAAAAEKKKAYQPFGNADVTDAMKERRLHVIASPFAPSFSNRNWHFSPLAERIVLKRKDTTGENPADVLQPIEVTPVPASWSNAMGAKWEGQGMLAHFDFDAFQAMPGEIDVVVITNHGERRCKIGLKDKKALR